MARVQSLRYRDAKYALDQKRQTQDWEKIEDFSKAHFEEMKSILIAEAPSVID